MCWGSDLISEGPGVISTGQPFRPRLQRVYLHWSRVVSLTHKGLALWAAAPIVCQQAYGSQCVCSMPIMSHIRQLRTKLVLDGLSILDAVSIFIYVSGPELWHHSDKWRTGCHDNHLQPNTSKTSDWNVSNMGDATMKLLIGCITQISYPAAKFSKIWPDQIIMASWVLRSDFASRPEKCVYWTPWVISFIVSS